MSPSTVSALTLVLVGCGSLLGVDWDSPHLASSADAAATGDGGGSDRGSLPETGSHDGRSNDGPAVQDSSSDDASPEADTSCTNDCTLGAARCQGSGVQTCVTAANGCTVWGATAACASGTCTGGQCTGACNPAGATQCSGNGVQTCGSNGRWGSPLACMNQTCVSGACKGMCAPGQTDPVVCGNCGTDTQTCSTSGSWQTSGTCAGQGACAPNATQSCNTYGAQTCSASCAWGGCSCATSPVCAPNATLCSGSNVQTCNACGQWGNPVGCGSGRTCMAGGCLDPGLVLPAPSGMPCADPGNIGTLCSDIEVCRISSTTGGRCEGCTGCGNLHAPCTTNADCDILFQCYTGYCDPLCQLTTPQTCGVPTDCINVGNVTTGVCKYP